MLHAARLAYLRSLERSPMRTKAMTSFVTFSITDALAQQRERVNTLSATRSAQWWDARRTVGSGLFGLLYMGPSNHLLWGKRWGLECGAAPHNRTACHHDHPARAAPGDQP